MAAIAVNLRRCAIALGITAALTWAAYTAHAESVLASDAFGRTSPLGWGRADVGGGAWIVGGYPAGGAYQPVPGVASVAPGLATLRVVEGSAVTTMSAVTLPTSADVDVSATMNASREQLAFGLVMRGSAAGSLQCLVISGTPWLFVIRNEAVNGGMLGTGLWIGTLPAVTSGPTVLRCEAQGSVLRAKAWPAGSAEPAGWQLTGADGVLAAGLSGIVLQADGVTATAGSVGVSNFSEVGI